MSMTRREAAIKSCEDRIRHLESVPPHYYGKRQRGRAIELEKVKIKALRPVSREQVEKVWRGNWDVSYDEQNGFTYVTCSKCGDETVLNGCFVTTEGEPCGLEDFCSVCGAPMTDEAVEMVMERLEALEGGKDV
nr:MAG TPA_asm: DNA-directed RNA polymerase [Bacteriophage sp.]